MCPFFVSQIDCLFLFILQQCCSLIEDINENLYYDFDMADINLSLENYEELFGYSQNFSEHLFENGGMASLFPNRIIPDIGTSTQDVKIAKVCFYV